MAEAQAAANIANTLAGIQWQSGQHLIFATINGDAQPNDMLLEVVLGISASTAMLFLPYLVKGFKISQKIELVAPASLKGRQPPREMTNSKIAKLRKKIRKNGFDKNFPIDVADINDQLIILDGHHRAAAAASEHVTAVPIRRYKVPREVEIELLMEVAETDVFRF